MGLKQPNHLTPTEQARLDQLDQERATLKAELAEIDVQRRVILTRARVRKFRA